MLPDILNNTECIKFISDISDKTSVIKFSDNGDFKNDKYIDAELANDLFSRIPDVVKQEHGLLRANNLIMTGMYSQGDSFGLHTDTGLYYNLQSGEKSRYTFLIYLNDGFSGGETEFYDDKFKLYKTITPKTGAGLLFDIDLWHKGNEIFSGNKYWIGIEVIGEI